MTSVQIPAPRRKLSEPIRDHLLALIQDGNLQPGATLPSERELMRDYQVGRPAVREAIQALQAMGLVTVRQGGRARVAEPAIGPLIDRMGETIHHLLVHSPANLEHLKQARILFETETARLAARKRSSSDIKRLRSILSAQRAARRDLARFVACDGEFHREIAVITGNPIFSALAEAVFQWLARFYRGAVSVPGMEALTIEEHAAILDGIERRDDEAAARAMRHHLERANELYRKTNLHAAREQE